MNELQKLICEHTHPIHPYVTVTKEVDGLHGIAECLRAQGISDEEVDAEVEGTKDIPRSVKTRRVRPCTLRTLRPGATPRTVPVARSTTNNSLSLRLVRHQMSKPNQTIRSDIDSVTRYPWVEGPTTVSYIHTWVGHVDGGQPCSPSSLQPGLSPSHRPSIQFSPSQPQPQLSHQPTTIFQQTRSMRATWAVLAEGGRAPRHASMTAR